MTCIEVAQALYAPLERILAQEGIDAEVIDLRTLLPLDRETILASVKKTNRLLVVHEDTGTPRLILATRGTDAFAGFWSLGGSTNPPVSWADCYAFQAHELLGLAAGIVTESAAILLTLADHFPQARLLPSQGSNDSS